MNARTADMVLFCSLRGAGIGIGIEMFLKAWPIDYYFGMVIAVSVIAFSLYQVMDYCLLERLDRDDS